MQNPKTSGSVKSGSGSEGARKTLSPRSVSSDRSSSRVGRQPKTTGIDGKSCTSVGLAPRIISPKVVDRVSPRGVVHEPKKRVGRIAELETQVSQLEDALNTVKDQLIVSESWKTQAKLDAEESRNEILALTFKLNESHKLVARFPCNETHDRHNEELKPKADKTNESETEQAESIYEELHILKQNMSAKNLLIEEMKNQLEDSKTSESLAHAFATETLLQLETAKKTMESLKLTSNEHNTVLFELQQSRARVSSLEEIIHKMKTADHKSEPECGHKSEIEELKADLMDKETELQCIREENEDLKEKLANLNHVKNDGLNEKSENEKLRQDFEALKSKSTDLETELYEKSNENEKLKLEIEKLETELSEKSNENEKLKLEFKKMNSVMEACNQDFKTIKSKLTEKSTENEHLKLEIKKTDGMNEEIKKSMNAQLESVKTSNGELESELKRLKTQMGQWRKAAEAATAMLCDENSDQNGRVMADRTWSMERYSPVKRVNISSPCNLDVGDDDEDDDDDDEFSRRKNGNVLKRIGVLWKKPQNK